MSSANIRTVRAVAGKRGHPVETVLIANADELAAELGGGGGNASVAWPAGQAANRILGTDASNARKWLAPAEAAAILPTGATGQPGLLSPDGSTIQADENGVLTVVGGGGVSLPIATTDVYDANFSMSQARFNRQIADNTDANFAAVHTEMETGFAAAQSALAGKADLADGKLVSNQVPANIPRVWVVPSGTLPTTVNAVVGDLCVVSGGKTYQLCRSPYWNIANWTETSLPSLATSSVDGLLSAADKRKLDASLYLGEIRLFPFRIEWLPRGWYFANGGGYPQTSSQGQALDSLPATLKADWGITVSGSVIYLPNLISNGNGYFLRAVDNSTRLPGSVQGDAIRNITGGTSLILAAEASGGGSGAMSLTVSEFRSDLIEATGGYRAWASAAFNAANAVPVATENRPLNIGMTPAIYLGV